EREAVARPLRPVTIGRQPAMPLLLIALSIIGGGGLLALLVPRYATRIGATACVAGGASGFSAALLVLCGLIAPSRIVRAWSLPVGSFSIALDPLAAVFLLPLFA